MIYAGRLTETLKLYHIVETISPSGFHDLSEELYRTVKAERVKMKQTYLVDGEELFHTDTTTFRIRAVEGIAMTDIVEYQGQRYRILQLDKYDRREIKIVIQLIND